jgi:hypothetical protein
MLSIIIRHNQGGRIHIQGHQILQRVRGLALGNVLEKATEGDKGEKHSACLKEEFRIMHRGCAYYREQLY